MRWIARDAVSSGIYLKKTNKQLPLVQKKTNKQTNKQNKPNVHLYQVSRRNFKF